MNRQQGPFPHCPICTVRVGNLPLRRLAFSFELAFVPVLSCRPLVAGQTRFFDPSSRHSLTVSNQQGAFPATVALGSLLAVNRPAQEVVRRIVLAVPHTGEENIPLGKIPFGLTFNVLSDGVSVSQQRVFVTSKFPEELQYRIQRVHRRSGNQNRPPEPFGLRTPLAPADSAKRLAA